MPPITKKKRAATAHTSCSARNRSRQDERPPGGPDRGSRHVMYCTAPHSKMAPTMPGMMPAANSLPMLVSVKMP